MVSLKRKSKLIFKIIGLLVLASGIFILIYHYSKIEKLDKESDIKIEEFLNEEIPLTNEVSIENTTIEEEKSDRQDFNYIAVLEIPSIDLKRGLVDPSSPYNNVNYNIQIIDNSTMPNVTNGNFVLASHNGASYISFFKNLNKMNINDKIYVYYQGYKYEYSLTEIYDTPKDGKVEIVRDYDKTTITLITCKKNSKDTQVVYIGYLTNTTTY